MAQNNKLSTAIIVTTVLLHSEKPTLYQRFSVIFIFPYMLRFFTRLIFIFSIYIFEIDLRETFYMSSLINFKLMISGFVSSNWGGQYAVGQVFRVALLEDHFVSRIYVSLNTTVKKFKVRYSLDDEGQFWRRYEELEVWRQVKHAYFV